MRQLDIILTDQIWSSLNMKRILRIMNYNTLVKKESRSPQKVKKGKLLFTEEYQIINKEEVTELEKNCFASNDCNSQFR